MRGARKDMRAFLRVLIYGSFLQTLLILFTILVVGYFVVKPIGEDLAGKLNKLSEALKIETIDR